MAIRALSTAQEATSPPSAGEYDADAPIGGRIRELRKAQGRTLNDVATSVGISVSYLSQIERDVSRLPIGVLKRIADALGVHMNWFFHSGHQGPADERDGRTTAATSPSPASASPRNCCRPTCRARSNCSSAPSTPVPTASSTATTAPKPAW
jgi:DNA-binding XRE family transcriptional regulator